MEFSEEVVMGISQFPGYAAVAALPAGGAVVLTDPCNSEIAIGAHAPAEVATPSEPLDNMVWVSFAASNGTNEVWGSRRVQFLAAYSAFLSFKCPGLAVKACPSGRATPDSSLQGATPDACLEIDAPASCVAVLTQWSAWQHEADNVLKVYGVPAMSIASVTLGCLEGSSVGSVGFCVPCAEGYFFFFFITLQPRLDTQVYEP